MTVTAVACFPFHHNTIVYKHDLARLRRCPYYCHCCQHNVLKIVGKLRREKAKNFDLVQSQDQLAPSWNILLHMAIYLESSAHTPKLMDNDGRYQALNVVIQIHVRDCSTHAALPHSALTVKKANGPIPFNMLQIIFSEAEEAAIKVYTHKNIPSEHDVACSHHGYMAHQQSQVAFIFQHDICKVHINVHSNTCVTTNCWHIIDKIKNREINIEPHCTSTAAFITTTAGSTRKHKSLDHQLGLTRDQPLKCDLDV
ncbi:hypothetical protein BGW80DRAFT_1256994 [Lactifluus volemus]|nr:hypothetical protein BGW80DRAFT_1256994 [Lactifluus volemus]